MCSPLLPSINPNKSSFGIIIFFNWASFVLKWSNLWKSFAQEPTLFWKHVRQLRVSLFHLFRRLPYPSLASGQVYRLLCLFLWLALFGGSPLSPHVWKIWLPFLHVSGERSKEEGRWLMEQSFNLLALSMVWEVAASPVLWIHW